MKPRAFCDGVNWYKIHSSLSRMTSMVMRNRIQNVEGFSAGLSHTVDNSVKCPYVGKVQSENTRRWGKDHCTVGLQFS